MQGLHKYGIRDWSELKDVIPNLEVRSLRISYRQTPTLVEMAKKIYEALYENNIPIKLISSSEIKKDMTYIFLHFCIAYESDFAEFEFVSGKLYYYSANFKKCKK